MWEFDKIKLYWPWGCPSYWTCSFHLQCSTVNGMKIDNLCWVQRSTPSIFESQHVAAVVCHYGPSYFKKCRLLTTAGTSNWLAEQQKNNLQLFWLFNNSFFHFSSKNSEKWQILYIRFTAFLHCVIVNQIFWGFRHLIKQNKTFRDVNTGSAKLWCFIDKRSVDDENNCWLRP